MDITPNVVAPFSLCGTFIAKNEYGPSFVLATGFLRVFADSARSYFRLNKKYRVCALRPPLFLKNKFTFVKTGGAYKQL